MRILTLDYQASEANMDLYPLELEKGCVQGTRSKRASSSGMCGTYMIRKGDITRKKAACVKKTSAMQQFFPTPHVVFVT